MITTVCVVVNDPNSTLVALSPNCLDNVLLNFKLSVCKMYFVTLKHNCSDLDSQVSNMFEKLCMTFMSISVLSTHDQYFRL